MESKQALFVLPDGLTEQELDVNPSDISSFQTVDDYLAYVCLERLKIPKSSSNLSIPEKNSRKTPKKKSENEENSGIKKRKLKSGNNPRNETILGRLPTSSSYSENSNDTYEDTSSYSSNDFLYSAFSPKYGNCRTVDDEPKPTILAKLNIPEESYKNISNSIENCVAHIYFLRHNISVLDSNTFKDKNLDLTIAYKRLPEMVKEFDKIADLLEEVDQLSKEVSEEEIKSNLIAKLMSRKLQKQLYFNLIRAIATENYKAEHQIIASARRIGKIISENKTDLFFANANFVKTNAKSIGGLKIIAILFHDFLDQCDLFS